LHLSHASGLIAMSEHFLFRLTFHEKILSISAVCKFDWWRWNFGDSAKLMFHLAIFITCWNKRNVRENELKCITLCHKVSQNHNLGWVMFKTHKLFKSCGKVFSRSHRENCKTVRLLLIPLHNLIYEFLWSFGEFWLVFFQERSLTKNQNFNQIMKSSDSKIKTISSISVILSSLLVFQ
jgi:hypothetical protein